MHLSFLLFFFELRSRSGSNFLLHGISWEPSLSDLVVVFLIFGVKPTCFIGFFRFWLNMLNWKGRGQRKHTVATRRIWWSMPEVQNVGSKISDPKSRIGFYFLGRMVSGRIITCVYVETRVLLPKLPYGLWDHFAVFVKKWVWPGNYWADPNFAGCIPFLVFLHNWCSSFCVAPRHEVAVSRILDPESRTQDPRSRILDPGSRILYPGSRILDPGSWNQDPGSRIQILQTQFLRSWGSFLQSFDEVWTKLGVLPMKAWQMSTELGVLPAKFWQISTKLLDEVSTKFQRS